MRDRNLSGTRVFRYNRKVSEQIVTCYSTTIVVSVAAEMTLTVLRRGEIQTNVRIQSRKQGILRGQGNIYCNHK